MENRNAGEVPLLGTLLNKNGKILDCDHSYKNMCCFLAGALVVALTKSVWMPFVMSWISWK